MTFFSKTALEKYRDYRINDLNSDRYKDEKSRGIITKLQSLEKQVCNGYDFGLPYLLLRKNNQVNGEKSIVEELNLNVEDLYFLMVKYGVRFSNAQFPYDPFNSRKKLHIPKSLIDEGDITSGAIRRIIEAYDIMAPHEDNYSNLLIGISQRTKINSDVVDRLLKKYLESGDDFLERIEDFRDLRILGIDLSGFHGKGSNNTKKIVFELQKLEKKLCNGYDFGLPYFLLIKNNIEGKSLEKFKTDYKLTPRKLNFISSYFKIKWLNRSELLIKYWTPEKREEHSKKQKVFWGTSEKRAEQSKKGKMSWTPEKRNNHSVAISKAHSTSEERMKQSKRAKVRWDRPGNKEELSERSIKYWRKPGVREKHSKMAKEMWARKKSLELKVAE